MPDPRPPALPGADAPSVGTGVVYLTQLLNGISYGLVFPVAAYYAESFGTSPTVIGLLLAVHPLARLVSGPLWGRLADRLGRRPVLLAGIGLAAAGHAVFGGGGSVAALFVGRLLTGLGSGDMVAAVAMITDTTAPADRAARIGQLRAAYGLGMLLGPLLGGGLGGLGLAIPALVASGWCGANLAVAALWLPETRSPGAGPAEEEGVALASVGPIRRTLGMVALTTAAVATVEAVLALAIEHVLVPRTHWPWPSSPVHLALLLTVGTIALWGATMVVVEGGLAGWLVRRHGERRLVRAGLALWIAAFALAPAAFLSGVAAGAGVVLAMALAVGLTNTAIAALFSRYLPESARGRGFGWLQAAAAAGEFVGPAVAGVLFEQWFGLPWLLGAALAAAALAAAIGLPEPRQG